MLDRNNSTSSQFPMVSEDQGKKIHSGIRCQLACAVIVMAVFGIIVGLTVGVTKYYESKSHDDFSYQVVKPLTRPPQLSTPPPPSREQTCYTDSCKDLTTRIRQGMDTSVNPCTDFHRYACGNWAKHHPLPSGTTEIDTFEILRKDVNKILKNILESSNPEQTDPLTKAQTYYRSCLNTSKIDSRGVEPLKQLLGQLRDTQNRGFNLQAMLEFVYPLGIQPLFAMNVSRDDTNIDRNIIKIGVMDLTDSEDFQDVKYKELKSYFNEVDEVPPFAKFLIDVFVLLGEDRFQATKNVQAARKLEAEIYLLRKKLYVASHRTTTIEHLSNYASFMNWNSFFSTIYNAHNVEVSSFQPVYLDSTIFMTKLDELLRSKSGPNVYDWLYNDNEPSYQKAMQTMIEFRLIQNFILPMSSSIQHVRKQLDKAVLGTAVDIPRWETCIVDMSEGLGLPLSPYFVNQTFNATTRTRAQEMVTEIKNAFFSNMTLDWLDNKTKQQADIKADAVTDQIGYPEFIFNTTKLQHDYITLDATSDNYFENYYNKKKFITGQNFALIHEKPKKAAEYADKNVQTVNAFYTRLYNKIIMPAGIMRPPFFEADQPNYMNFGGLGTIVGHELIHGFDNKGRKYDKEGRKTDWWSLSAEVEFETLSQCFVDQYSEFSVGNTNVDGEKTLGENIADNGGLKMAYKAYESWASKHEPELVLPDLHLTQKQLFFLTFAQNWCNIEQLKAEEAEAKEMVHSPDQFRILGTLRNSDEFAEAFYCRKGSPMNPVHKCKLW